MFFDPLKVFEYLAAAKPTITLDSPNILKLFRPEEHLIVVAPGDVAALGAAIQRLVGLEDRGRALGEAGRRIVCELYSWDAHASQLTGIFEELVRERSLS
jgi:glycosyltransferase involved in cell wall biosynthesis